MELSLGFLESLLSSTNPPVLRGLRLLLQAIHVYSAIIQHS